MITPKRYEEYFYPATGLILVTNFICMLNFSEGAEF